MSFHRLTGSPDFLRPKRLDGGAGSASRQELALKAIDGKEDGVFTSNPWNPVFDFDDNIVQQIRANGGVAILLELGDPTDLLDKERLAVLWDDTVLAVPARVVNEGDRVLLIIDDVKGERLSVWCTDLLPVTVVKVSPARDAPAIVAEENARKADDDKKPNAFQKFIDGVFGVQKTVGTVGVIVGGVVLYYVLKNKVL